MGEEQRHYTRIYEQILPEYFPIKLIGAFIAVDFAVGCPYCCSFCISKRNPSREALSKDKIVIDNRVDPKKTYSWLKSMPSYQKGVQIRIGHDTDAGCEFKKSSQLIELIDKDRHSVTYLTRKPFNQEELKFFRQYRQNLLLKLTATPRSESLEIHRNPFDLIDSAETIDSKMKYWIIGPLVKDNADEAKKLLCALPKGSRLFLKELNYNGIPNIHGIEPITQEEYAKLEKIAEERGHIVTEYFCDSLARVGKGFFDVDKITQQENTNKKERECKYCTSCQSFILCHGDLDLKQFRRHLKKELDFLELHLAEEPKRIGPRSFEITVKEPSSRGEETYLNHAMPEPVSININTHEKGRSNGGSFQNIDREVLRRWYKIGFLPTTELNMVAHDILECIQKYKKNKY